MTTNVTTTDPTHGADTPVARKPPGDWNEPMRLFVLIVTNVSDSCLATVFLYLILVIFVREGESLFCNFLSQIDCEFVSVSWWQCLLWIVS